MEAGSVSAVVDITQDRVTMGIVDTTGVGAVGVTSLCLMDVEDGISVVVTPLEFALVNTASLARVEPPGKNSGALALSWRGSLGPPILTLGSLLLAFPCCYAA